MLKTFLMLRSKRCLLFIILGLCILTGLLYFLTHINNTQKRSDDAFKKIQTELRAVGFDNPQVFTSGACYLDKDAGFLFNSTCSSNVLKDELVLTPDTENIYAANIQQLEEKLIKQGWNDDPEQNLWEDDSWIMLKSMGTDISTLKKVHQVAFAKNIGRTHLDIKFIPYKAPDSIIMYFSAKQTRTLGIF